MTKYRAVPTTVDGIRFDSKREAKRYQELCLLEKAGEIRRLELQPQFRIVVDGFKICTYFADFAYYTGMGSDEHLVVEDVKGVKTPVYKLKRKLVRALFGIEIQET